MESFNKFIINKKHLLENISAIKKQLNNGVLLCACIKANAYSLSAKEVAKIIENEVDYFAVSCVQEAIEIRNELKNARILILGRVLKEYYSYCAENHFEISISSVSDLKNIKLKHPLCVHFALNTGMNRYGFSSEKEINKALNIINKNDNLKLVGAFSHFAYSKNNIETTKQYEKFVGFKALFPNNILFSISASGCYDLLNFQENMVRVGLNMFLGSESSPNSAIEIKSKIVFSFKVKKGEKIGYDCTFVAQKDMQIGVVPLGYADGIPRGLSNCGSVVISNRLAKIVGLVCMDCFMIDLTNINAKENQEVIVLGQSKNQSISIYDWAKLTNDSPYCLLTNLKYNRCNYITQ
ncbi:MAG: alanine racemase [Clostridia bacterium]|nr:alanine racemase [Clostridia bacterium]